MADEEHAATVLQAHIRGRIERKRVRAMILGDKLVTGDISTKLSDIREQAEKSEAERQLQRQKDRIRGALTCFFLKYFIFFLVYICFFSSVYHSMCEKVPPVCDHPGESETVASAKQILRELGYDIHQPRDKACSPEPWTIIDAVYFVMVSATTVGFGDLTPSAEGKETELRWICIAQTFFGVLFLSSLYSDFTIAWMRAEAEEGFVVMSEEDESNVERYERFATWAMLRSVGKVALVLCTGTVFFHFTEEDLDLFGSFYYCWVTTTTIGFGDINVNSDTSKVFMSVYLLVSCSAMADMISNIANYNLEVFLARQLKNLLAHQHTGDFFHVLDVYKDGYVTSGEFLAAYLTTTSTCRMLTCKVILNKFRNLAGGNDKLDLEALTQAMNHSPDTQTTRETTAEKIITGESGRFDPEGAAIQAGQMRTLLETNFAGQDSSAVGAQENKVLV